MTRAAKLLESAIKQHEAANNDFSTRIQTKGVKASDLDKLEKKVLTLATNIVPDVTDEDITITVGKDRKTIVVSIADIPTSIHDKLDKEIQKAVK